jgi:hypothetical protein
MMILRFLFIEDASVYSHGSDFFSLALLLVSSLA